MYLVVLKMSPAEQAQELAEEGIPAAPLPPELAPVQPGHAVRCWLYSDHEDHKAPLKGGQVIQGHLFS